jgi:hypothetical protein
MDYFTRFDDLMLSYLDRFVEYVDGFFPFTKRIFARILAAVLVLYTISYHAPNQTAPKSIISMTMSAFIAIYVIARTEGRYPARNLYTSFRFFISLMTIVFLIMDLSFPNAGILMIFDLVYYIWFYVVCSGEESGKRDKKRATDKVHEWWKAGVSQITPVAA